MKKKKKNINEKNGSSNIKYEIPLRNETTYKRLGKNIISIQWCKCYKDTKVILLMN